MNLKDLEKEAREFVSSPLGIDFLDDRVEAMRNPQGYVADYYRFFYFFTQKYRPCTVVELGS